MEFWSFSLPKIGYTDGMAVAKKLLTAEEFGLLPEHRDHELIDGELVEIMPTNDEHGEIVTELLTRLRTWAKANKTGRVGTESGFILRRNPDRLRGPDIFFIKADRTPGFTGSFYDIYPDLVVEVISDSDTVKVIKGKLNDYFSAGTQLIWLVYPSLKQVEAHTPTGSTIFFADDTLQADLLPGFSCNVAELFEF